MSIDADGLVNNATIDNMNKLGDQRRQELEKIPGDLNGATEMRKISLRRLEAAIDECAKNNKPLPDAIKYLAGLQHIRYVFVYPEQKDIVLVGPGEGWKVDGRGNVVGVTTGRPVMLLDDLLVALRTAKAAAQGGITCSIDPDAGRSRPIEPGTSSARHRFGDDGGGVRESDGNPADPLAWRARHEPLRSRPGGGRLSHEADRDGAR